MVRPDGIKKGTYKEVCAGAFPLFIGISPNHQQVILLAEVAA